MKSKHIKFFGVALLCLFTSCSSLLEPKLAEHSQILNDVYRLADKDVNQESNEWKWAIAVLSGGSVEQDKSNHSKDVKMVEWHIANDQIGDDYIGYYIVYKVQLKNKSVYTLVNLLEWDDEENYEITHIATENSMSAITYYLD